MYKNIVLHLDESIRPKVLEWPRLPRIRLPLEQLGCLAKYFSCWHTGCIDVHGWRLNPRNEPQTNERKHCTSSKQGRQMKRGLTSLQTLRQTCAICCDKASTAAIKFSCSLYGKRKKLMVCCSLKSEEKFSQRAQARQYEGLGASLLQSTVEQRDIVANMASQIAQPTNWESFDIQPQLCNSMSSMLEPKS